MRYQPATAGVLLSACVVSGAAGQEPAQTPRFELQGVVMDVTTETPVSGATVTVMELNRRVTTDESGRFFIADFPQGRYTFRTEGLGYFPNVEPSVVQDGYTLIVWVAPSPIQLEGLNVTASTRSTEAVSERSLARLDRDFERRLNATGFRALVSDREVLLTTGAPSVEEVLRDRHGFWRVECPHREEFEPTCVVARGRPRVLSVLVDGVKMASAWIALDSYLPAELYRLEFHPSLAEVHMFTMAHALGLARTGRRPASICIVC